MDFSSIDCAEKLVLKRGYLKKIPNQNKFGASFKKWERRWFVFCTVNGSPCLEYYESEDTFQKRDPPINLIWLTTTQYVIQAMADEKHENMFSIGMTDRILNLIAPTRDEMESWLRSLDIHLTRLGIIDSAEDRYAAFPGAPPGATVHADDAPANFRKPSDSQKRTSFHKPTEDLVDLKKTSYDQPTHVALPDETAGSGDMGSGGEIRQEFEDIVEAKAKAKREFEVIESQRRALEGGFEDIAEAKAKAKQELEAAEAKRALEEFEDIAEAKAKAKKEFEAAEAKRRSSDHFEDVTAVKAAAQARTVSECSSGSDQVFEDIETAKRQAQVRMASLGSDPSDSFPPLPAARTLSIPVPAPRSTLHNSPVAPPRSSRKESIDEIDLIKAQNKRNEMQQQAQLGGAPLRDPRSPLPPLPLLPDDCDDDDDVKKTKSALEPPEKPGVANCEKSPRSRRHLEQQMAGANGRAEENMYEPPRPGGLPPDFPSKPPPPPPTHPGMRRHSAEQGPTDMYGALWNDDLPPMLPDKKRSTPLKRQDSRGLRVLSDEEISLIHRSASSSSEPPPLPKGRPSGPPPLRSNSLTVSPLQAAGTFDPDAMKNLMESTSEYNRCLLEQAREKGLKPAQPQLNPAPSSALRQHSVKGIMMSPATTVSLKEREVDQLRQEINHPGGVQTQLRKKDCYQTLALVDNLDAVWVAGWNQKASPFLHNAFHIGDRIVSINGRDVVDTEHAQKLIRHSSNDVRVEFVVRRTPYARVFAIKRSAEGESLGFRREGGTAEIYQLTPDGLAARHGLPMQACSLDGTSPCHWVLTEINNRPLNLFFKDKEIEHRLNAVGKDISIMVQPYDFIYTIRKLLKKVKGYKDFIVQ